MTKTVIVAREYDPDRLKKSRGLKVASAVVLAVFAAFVTAAVTASVLKGQPLEDPNVWVIRVPVEAEGHTSPSEHPATFADEVGCEDFLGSAEFAEDLEAYKLYEHIEHAGRVKFGVPRCEQRGVDPA